MTSQQRHSEPSSSTVPIRATKQYATHGGYENISRMKTYVTGPLTAASGILVIYDIVGYHPDTIQGADILATSDSEHQYRVFIPDILEDNFANLDWRVAPNTPAALIPKKSIRYPPIDDEKKNKLWPYLEGHANPDRNSMKVPGILHVLRKHSPFIKSWAILGFCWGAKMASINARDPTLFTAAAQCHPGFLDPRDAASVRIPMCMLASKDEDETEVKKYGENLKGEKHIEILRDMPHGFLSANGDLDNPRKKAEYLKAYKTLLEFFAIHLYGKGERRLEEILPQGPPILGYEQDNI